MTQLELEKMKEQIFNRIRWLESVMSGARKEGQVYNYLYYDGEILALHRVLNIIYEIETAHNKEQPQ